MVNFGTPLGPKPGTKKRANKLNTSGLGRSLVNQKEKARKGKGIDSDRYTTDIEPSSRPNLDSRTQERSLDEFLATAELADTDFTTDRTANIKIVASGGQSLPNPHSLSAEQKAKLSQQHYENAGKLTVPRRPQWTKEMTPFELDRLEKDAFLNWRRSLAELQEDKNLLLTPFERNIEVWRQLWRVIERSDLIVQIVDARNPSLYRSEDLDKYVREVSEKKRVLLLVNKADLLSKRQRQEWQKYFLANNIHFAYFSARSALVEQQQESGSQSHSDSTDTERDSEETSNSTKAKIELDSIEILSVDQLEGLFKQAAPEIEEGRQLQVGLVGYPNVGKSSTINALIGGKKVSVSSTPGKTKHFQTISLSSEMMLCDCPGLVFPNFAQTNGDLVCNGVLPIDQLREYFGPTGLICERVPKFFMEAVYGIHIQTKPIEEGGDGQPTANELLSSYARARGYMRTGGGGEPDTSRAARYVLKDYVDGKLLFITPPPSFDGSSQDFNQETFSIDSLTSARRSQILEAIKDSHEGIIPDVVDLEKELKGLKFSQHNGEAENGMATARSTKSKGKSRKEMSGLSELDADFFGKSNPDSVASLPFHLQGNQKGSSKKHFKGRKGRQ